MSSWVGCSLCNFSYALLCTNPSDVNFFGGESCINRFTLSCLPFSQEIDTDSFLNCVATSQKCYDDVELRKYFYEYSKNDMFNLLDSNYYTCDQFNRKVRSITNKCEISIFHLNIRSLNSKQSAFCQLISLLDLDFDVLVLSEIWSYNISFYCNLFDGYDFYYVLPQSSSIGGIGMYVKKLSFCEIRSDLQLPKHSDVRVDDLWIEICKNKTKYIVGGIYRHPNSNINIFTDLLDDNLNKISSKKRPCFIVGDINIDFLKYKNLKCIEDYMNNLLVHGLLPVLLLPTRITKKSATVVDHIYYYEGSNRLKPSKLYTGNIFSDLSDHLPNFVILSNVKQKIDYSLRPFTRLFTQKNKSSFDTMLGEIEWHHVVYSKTDVNEGYNNLLFELNRCFNTCFPLVRMSRKLYRNKKWFTKGLGISSRKKDNLFKTWLLSRKEDDRLVY